MAHLPCNQEFPHFKVVIAMELGRGIGCKKGLPWPFIKTDYEFYTGLSSSPSDSGPKTIHIMGRRTFECVSEENKKRNFNVVISQTLKERPEHVGCIANDFEEALRMASVERYDASQEVWVMGGQRVLEDALKSPWCQRVYLTRIFGNFQSEAFMPEFESDYKLVRDPTVNENIIEENGVKYRFEVYEPAFQTKTQE